MKLTQEDRWVSNRYRTRQILRYVWLLNTHIRVQHWVPHMSLLQSHVYPYIAQEALGLWVVYGRESYDHRAALVPRPDMADRVFYLCLLPYLALGFLLHWSLRQRGCGPKERSMALKETLEPKVSFLSQISLSPELRLCLLLLQAT